MIIYAVLMFASAIAFAILGVCIVRGNANLVNCYRPERVKDKPLYCRKLGTAMLFMAAVMTVSGVVGLLGEWTAVAAVAVLMVGLTCGIVWLFSVQKKYGGGIF